MKNINWHFRKNVKRKIGSKSNGGHPSLVIGETDDGKSFVNIGLTKSKKRGHHKNIPIHNPQNWSSKAGIHQDLGTNGYPFPNYV